MGREVRLRHDAGGGGGVTLVVVLWQTTTLTRSFIYSFSTAIIRYRIMCNFFFYLEVIHKYIYFKKKGIRIIIIIIIIITLFIHYNPKKNFVP